MLAWNGRVWLNPPYGQQTGKWLARMVAHDHGTALVFARTETEDWHRHIWAKATAIHFLEGRLYFFDVHGKEAQHNAGAPSALIAYGKTDAAKLLASGIPGKFVMLR